MSGSDADGDRWPNEPDEFDPESIGPDRPDPDSIGPDKPDSESIGPIESDPESLGPDAPSFSDAESPDNPEAVQLFWKLLIVFNAAILALSLGPMLVVFENQWEFGMQIFLVGMLGFAYGVFRYHQFRANQDDD